MSSAERAPGAVSEAKTAFGTNLMGSIQAERDPKSKLPLGSQKRIRSERERDIVEIASLYLRGWRLIDIQQHINETRPYKLATQTISYDLKIIRARWLESTLVDFNAAKSKELAKLDELERAYWDAWEDSRKKKELNVVETIEDATGEKKTHAYSRTKGKRATESRDGSVQFLMGVERCINKRCAILGLDAPKKVDVNWRLEAEQMGVDPDAALSKLVNEFVGAAEKNMMEDKTIDAEWSDVEEST